MARLALEGAAVLVGTIVGLAAGSIRPVPQDETLATAAPLLRAVEGAWDPAWSAGELSGRVRGFDPWPGVWATCAGKRLRILEARAIPDANTDADPGTLLAFAGDALRVACAERTVVAISSVQPEGGRAMRVRDAVNGRLLTPGVQLGRPQPKA
jgi:methionyl-tRNA formyltransferase